MAILYHNITTSPCASIMAINDEWDMNEVEETNQIRHKTKKKYHNRRRNLVFFVDNKLRYKNDCFVADYTIWLMRILLTRVFRLATFSGRKTFYDTISM
ncbi:hypothetical protein AVEN_269590-1 [Araneus ventricosus]|uniref:Uncharacterized protein n=1 Tax=Araneus ventricosus TaxID=182803 RepID=A0A4Y2CE25_ARAVE|nr:hypothetical protein AVEN_269590-1 [Araneus ventricosus]